MLSLHHVTVSLGSRVALRDVCLDVKPTEVVCILGEEGSGKTTLLRLLLRDLEPDEGAIKIDTAFLSQLPREVLRMMRERIGTVGEKATLDPTLTIAQNIALPLDRRGVRAPERDRAVSDLLKRFSLTSIAAQYPDRVSSGERRLTAIARAIVTGPLILLLDEPFQGLSDRSAATVAALLENMRKKGATVIVASAEERTAGFFSAPRIARLARGKLTEELAQPTPATHVRNVANAATAELIEQTAPAPSVLVAKEQSPLPETKKIRITAVGSL